MITGGMKKLKTTHTHTDHKDKKTLSVLHLTLYKMHLLHFYAHTPDIHAYILHKSHSHAQTLPVGLSACSNTVVVVQDQ